MYEHTTRQSAGARVLRISAHGEFYADGARTSSHAIRREPFNQGIGNRYWLSAFGQVGQKSRAHTGGRTIFAARHKNFTRNGERAGITRPTWQVGTRSPAPRREHDGLPTLVT